MIPSIIAGALNLAEFAPVIARWLGGDKAQEVAAQVVERAKRITGAQDAQEAASYLRENAQWVAAFQREIMQMETALAMEAFHDLQNARERDISLYKAVGHNWRADIMVLSAALGLIICLVALAYYSKNLPGEAIGIISTVAGIFGSCLKDAYAFEFGSSRGSKEKDLAMQALAHKNSSWR